MMSQTLRDLAISRIHSRHPELDERGVLDQLLAELYGFHGAPRATQDIDIVISPTLGSLNRFLGLLPEDKYYVSRDAALDAYSRESIFNVVDFASGWKALPPTFSLFPRTEWWKSAHKSNFEDVGFTQLTNPTYSPLP